MWFCPIGNAGSWRTRSDSWTVAQLGFQVLTWSAPTGPLSELIGVACGVELAALGAGAVWIRRFRVSAARVGAVPPRPDARHEH